MLGEPIKYVMEKAKFVVAPPHTTVRAAAKLMEKRKVSAVLVVEGKRLVGIFTERDAVFRVIAGARDLDATVLSEVMTKKPVTVAPDETFGYALLLMHQKGFRHVPVVVDGEPIGIVSARNALDPDLEEFESEARRREQIRRKAAVAGT
ncbi:MAG: CBS domain-containing protein [Proteobacteria bacterium]|nr:CBS domain-containing protein [Pseudomonadota bacterium]